MKHMVDLFPSLHFHHQDPAGSQPALMPGALPQQTLLGVSRLTQLSAVLYCTSDFSPPKCDAVSLLKPICQGTTRMHEGTHPHRWTKCLCRGTWQRAGGGTLKGHGPQEQPGQEHSGTVGGQRCGSSFLVEADESARLLGAVLSYRRAWAGQHHWDKLVL